MAENIRPRVEKALHSIVENRSAKALNYAVGYAQEGLRMMRLGCSDYDLRTQLLYVANNITHWRGDAAVVARGTIKEAIKVLNK